MLCVSALCLKQVDGRTGGGLLPGGGRGADVAHLGDEADLRRDVAPHLGARRDDPAHIVQRKHPLQCNQQLHVYF